MGVAESSDVDTVANLCLMLPCVREAVVDCCWMQRPMRGFGDNGIACANRAWNIVWRARKRVLLLKLWEDLDRLSHHIGLNDTDMYEMRLEMTSSLADMYDLL